MSVIIPTLQLVDQVNSSVLMGTAFPQAGPVIVLGTAGMAAMNTAAVVRHTVTVTVFSLLQLQFNIPPVFQLYICVDNH